MADLEAKFQAALIKRLEATFPGCVVLVKPGFYVQGFPDLLILHGTRWVALECKRKKPTSKNDYEPNQEWYLEMLDGIGMAYVIYPENEQETIDAILQAWGAG